MAIHKAARRIELVVDMVLLAAAAKLNGAVVARACHARSRSPALRAAGPFTARSGDDGPAAGAPDGVEASTRLLAHALLASLLVPRLRDDALATRLRDRAAVVHQRKSIFNRKAY